MINKIKYIDIIKEYEKEGKAIAHFNISNLDQLNIICEVASDLVQPIIIGASEGEREYMGVRMLRAMIDIKNKEHSIPIFLNADHTYSLDKIKQVVDSGYDSVIIDGAKLDYEDNVNLVKSAVGYVREYNRINNTNIITEAELGYIGQSSSLNAHLPEGVSEDNLTTIEQAMDFVNRTGIDLFAPAVGNVHGMLIDAPNPRLHIDRIRELKDALPNTPFVLHGGSGIIEQDISDAIKNGISIIHINTEIRKAYRDGVKRYMDGNPLEIAPYKFGKAGQLEMRKVIEDKINRYIK